VETARTGYNGSDAGNFYFLAWGGTGSIEWEVE
jgi:hypothetical protein